jgi:hypothetical protein
LFCRTIDVCFRHSNCLKVRPSQTREVVIQGRPMYDSMGRRLVCANHWGCLWPNDGGWYLSLPHFQSLKANSRLVVRADMAKMIDCTLDRKLSIDSLARTSCQMHILSKVFDKFARKQESCKGKKHNLNSVNSTSSLSRICGLHTLPKGCRMEGCRDTSDLQGHRHQCWCCGSWIANGGSHPPCQLPPAWHGPGGHGNISRLVCFAHKP